MVFKLGLVVAATVLTLSSGAMAADPRHPVIPGYGAIAPMPDAKERPDRSLHYRVLFSVTRAAASPDQVNPNLPLVAALRAAGVSVRVCSQALVGNKVDPAVVNKGIEIDVSALTTMATLQLRGWALIPD